jgi:HlyD family secretion protein
VKKRVFFAGILVTLIVAGLLYYYFAKNQKGEQGVLQVSGNIEATEVDVGFKISGRIVELTVDEGYWVEKGKLLARLEDEDLRQRVHMARASLLSAQAQLSKLLAGSRPEEIREAEAALRQAEYDLENKRTNFDRMKALYDRHVIPRELFDNAETALKIATASRQRAKENYDLVLQGPRKEDIDNAGAQVKQAQASLTLAETQLSYSVLRSPLTGVILVKSGEVGEVVNPGTPILTMADIENVWLRAYIPETDLGKVKWGQEVIVTTDLHPKREYRGTISFLSSQAEFTPKNIQTEKERVTLVYRIKVDLPNPDRELKPGMPADGKILLSSEPRKP